LHAPPGGIESVDRIEKELVILTIAFNGLRRKIRQPAVRPFNAGNVIALRRLLNAPPFKKAARQGL